MKPFTLSLLAALFTTAAAAQSQWRIGAGYAPMIGLKTEFSGFGNFQNPFPVPAPAGHTDYRYLNGSVLVDASGNFGDVTSYWAYNNASQIDLAAFGGAGAVNFDTLADSMTQAGKVDDSSVAAAGSFELFGYREFGAVSIPAAAGRRSAWGLRIGFQHTRVDQTNGDSLGASMTTITDSFNLDHVIPPAAPFTGAFLGGFGDPLLGDTPTRKLGTTTATITGSRRLEVQLNITQIGSYIEIPVAKYLDLMLEGGFLVGVASGTYDFTTTVTVPGAGSQTSSGHTTRNRLLPGLYTGLGLTCNITPSFGLQASARYQFMRQFDLTANGSKASLNFDSAFVLGFSAIWRF
ncbi:MAG: hypothetical protein B7Z37_14990 [Verrucomicrobia bacterium 12-59-8]|nr:MAG: hypothetical protein B7Z37_14990 [Verrucomicrobia bacterium 12-59-8]